MTLVQQTNEVPYVFIPEEKMEQFEKIAKTVYREAVLRSGKIPVLSSFHFFSEDVYKVSEALFDFAQDIHYSAMEESGLYPGKMVDWNDETWEHVQEEFMGSYEKLQFLILDDIESYWSRQQIIYYNEHRTMSEIPFLENACLQEVW